MSSLGPIRPNVRAEVSAIPAAQSRPERWHRNVVGRSGELFSRSLNLVVDNLSRFPEGLGRG